MKKLNLEKLKLAAEDVLQRSQMEFIYGGSGSDPSCQVQCDNWTNFPPMEVPHCSQGDLLCSGDYKCFHC